MSYSIVNINEFTVAGQAIRTNNKNAMETLGRAWEKFISNGIYNNIQGKVNQQTIGLYYNYQSDMNGDYAFMACAETNTQQTDEYDIVTIPSGKYAKFTTTGHIQKAVAETWQEIWQSDLNRKYSYDFEIYHNNSEDMNNTTIDIYIAIH